MASARACRGSRCPGAWTSPVGFDPRRPRTRLAAAAVLAIVAVPALLWGVPPDVAFDAPFVALQATLRPRFVVAGDFDADGATDFVLASDGEVRAFLNRGLTQYTPSSPYPLADPLVFTSADIDRDGRLDLVATLAANRVVVCAGNGDGTFRAAANLATDVTPSSLVAKDLTDDGIPDLIVGNFGSRRVSLFRGLGAGTFAAREDWTVPGYPEAVGVADLDANGHADLVVALRGAGLLAVLERDGSGAFTGRTVTYPVTQDPHGILVENTHADAAPDILVFGLNSTSVDCFVNSHGDFTRTVAPLPAYREWTSRDVNGDGRVDLALVSGSDVTVALGSPAGGFSPLAALHTAGAPSAPTLADVNGDGRFDLLTLHENQSLVAVALGSGTGTFGTRNELHVARPGRLASADLNRDGRPDIVATTEQGGIVSFLATLGGTFTNRTTALAVSQTDLLVGDLDGDNVPDAVVSLAGSRVTILGGQGDGSFVPTATVAVGRDPAGIVALDANADRFTDLVVACRGSDYATLLQGHGDGEFSNASRPSFATGSLPVGVALGELNGDGKADLAVATEGDNNVSVLLGLGDGLFRSTVQLQAGGRPRGVVIANINEDRYNDLVIPNWASNTVTLAWGDALGAFQNQMVLEGISRPVAVLVTDLNGDRKNDLVVVREGMGVTVFIVIAHGFFAPPVEYAVPGATCAAVGDLNGDGWPEIALGREGTNDVVVLPGDGTGRLGAANTYAVGAGPTSVVIAELNGDAKAELAVTCSGSSSLAVLFGRSVGFDPPLLLPTASEPVRVTTLDADGDGRLDLLVASRTGVVHVFRNLGRRAFAPRADIAVETAVADVVPGDLNGDGHTDLVFANHLTDGVVSILYGREGGFVSSPLLATESRPTATATGDLNGDGRPDFVAANSGAGSVSVFLGTGNGTFETLPSVGVGAGPAALACADLDSDGRLDLIVANSDSSSVSIRMGRGDGTFRSVADVACGLQPLAVACGDMNRDGDPDLVVANSGAGTVSILLGSGDGRFGARMDYGTGDNPSDLLLVDLDGDRSLDVAVANAASGTISILKNRTTPVPVTVEGLEAQSDDAGVTLAWRLSAEAVARTVTVQVERANQPAGPWQDCAAERLLPAATMQFVDGPLAAGAHAWFRVVLHTATGEQLFSPAVEVVGIIGTRAVALDPIAWPHAGAPVTLRYRLAHAGPASLAIFDVRGRCLRVVSSGEQGAGLHVAVWDRRDAAGARVARGVYVVRLENGATRRSRRLVLAEQ